MGIGKEEFVDPFERGARWVGLWTARYYPMQACFDAIFGCRISVINIFLGKY